MVHVTLLGSIGQKLMQAQNIITFASGKFVVVSKAPVLVSSANVGFCVSTFVLPKAPAVVSSANIQDDILYILYI